MTPPWRRTVPTHLLHFCSTQTLWIKKKTDLYLATHTDSYQSCNFWNPAQRYFDMGPVDNKDRWWSSIKLWFIFGGVQSLSNSSETCLRCPEYSHLNSSGKKNATSNSNKTLGLKLPGKQAYFRIWDAARIFTSMHLFLERFFHNLLLARIFESMKLLQITVFVHLSGTVK